MGQCANCSVPTENYSFTDENSMSEMCSDNSKKYNVDHCLKTTRNYLHNSSVPFITCRVKLSVDRGEVRRYKSMPKQNNQKISVNTNVTRVETTIKKSVFEEKKVAGNMWKIQRELFIKENGEEVFTFIKTKNDQRLKTPIVVANSVDLIIGHNELLKDTYKKISIYEVSEIGRAHV